MSCYPCVVGRVNVAVCGCGTVPVGGGWLFVFMSIAFVTKTGDIILSEGKIFIHCHCVSFLLV